MFSYAEVQARESVRYEPKVANSHQALARALLGIGAFAEAEREARAALAFPQTTMTPISRAAEHTTLGAALQMQLKVVAAEQEYKAAIQADPKFGQAYMLFGSLLNFIGKPKQAEDLLTKAVELLPENTKAWTEMVIAQTNEHKFE